MNIFLIIIGFILFLWFSFPVTLNVLNFANVLGMVFAFLIILYGRFFKNVNTTVKAFWHRKYGKAVLSIITAVALAGVAIVTVITSFMISSTLNSPDKETTVVVLGCKVNPNGPSIMLTSRLEATYDFLTENSDVVCVLSGGQGADEHISEARAMYNWLTEKGIDKSRLYIEDKSTSTRENLLFSKEIIEKNNLSTNITIITNEFHQYRAKTIAKALNINSFSYPAKTPIYLFPTYYVRELFAIIYEWVI